MSPADHAAALLADPTALHHAEALADAADHADESLRGAGLSALFGGLVEPLNDSFRPAGRDAYATIFSHIVWRVCARDPSLAQALAGFGITDGAALLARYQVARRSMGAAPAEARRIVVLSRVTIGADVLLTTVVLQRLHQRYPQAELVVLGDGKLAGLIGGLPQVRVRPLAYGRRGPLRERLSAWLTVLEAVQVEAPDLVIAPDSRLDQLGILPVTADPTRYFLWENTLPESRPAESLAASLDRWLAARLGLPAAPRVLPRVAFDESTATLARILAAAFGPGPLVAVKLDHGGNPAKALPRAAEVLLLKTLRERGWRILLDRGFGSAELASSDALLAEAGWTALDLDDSGKGLGHPVDDLTPGVLSSAPVLRFHGSIGGWAAALAACRLAISYDSVGHHLAAALGIPLVTAFTGHPDERFLAAWCPQGSSPVTLVAIPTAAKESPAEWQRVMEALPTLPGPRAAGAHRGL